MNNTATAGVRDRVTEVLRRHYKDEAWLARSATGGYGATVTAGQHRERLPQYAATLREAGFLVADHSARGRLYVRDHGREHDVAMAREVAGILRSAYDEHARAHGSAGTDKPAEASEVAAGGGFTIEREGREYDVIVVPLGPAQAGEGAAR